MPGPKFTRAQVSRIAAIHGEVFDLLRFHGSADRGSLGLYERCGRADFDGIAHGSDGELDIDAELGGRAELNPRLYGLFESRRLDLERVGTDEQIGQHLIAVTVG